MTEVDPLRRTLDAITEAGKLKACAYAVAQHRGWKHAVDRASGLPDAFTSMQRWTASLSHMLSREHRYRYGFEDHLVVCRVLGYDPAPFGEMNNAA